MKETQLGTQMDLWHQACAFGGTLVGAL